MADRRMFSKKIIDSDAFLDMPATTQMLYFHLSMRADDDGFINNPKRIARMVGASDDDMRVLLSKRFIIGFDSGVVVIKHWRIHNYIAKDRYHGTDYVDELSQLQLKDNGAYTDRVDESYTDCIQDVSDSYTEDRLGKDRIDKDSKSKETSHAYGEYGWVKLTATQYSKLINDLGEEELQRCISYVDESAQSNGNKNKWKDWNLVLRKCSKQGWGKQFTPAREDTWNKEY